MKEVNQKEWPFTVALLSCGITVLLGLFLAVVFALLLGAAWNMALPSLLGVPPLTYAQAYGCVVLVGLVMSAIHWVVKS